MDHIAGGANSLGELQLHMVRFAGGATSLGELHLHMVFIAGGAYTPLVGMGYLLLGIRC